MQGHRWRLPEFMVDLKVSYASLDSSEQSLQRMATELEGADARRAANVDVWGSSDVAMGEFVDNWTGTASNWWSRSRASVRCVPVPGSASPAPTSN